MLTLANTVRCCRTFDLNYIIPITSVTPMNLVIPTAPATPIAPVMQIASALIHTAVRTSLDRNFHI